MKTHLEQDACRFMAFRRSAFKEHIANITNIVTGRSTPFSQFITDANGNISDEKIDQLISEMIDCLDHYKRMTINEYCGLDDITKELYECFLYCTIQGISHISRIDTLFYLPVTPAATFSNIFEMANDRDTYFFTDRMTILQNEYDAEIRGYCQMGFWGPSNIAFELLTGKTISSTYTDDEKTTLKDPYDDMYEHLAAQNDMDIEDYYNELLDDNANSFGFDTNEELENHLANLNSDSENEFDEQIEEDIAFCESVAKSHAEWVKTVVSPEKFISKYMRYRELYFKTGHYNMQDDIENMIDVFLYEQQLSAFSLGDKYGMIAYRTERLESTLENELRKARCGR